MEQTAPKKEKFSFIVYEGAETPRYYEMKKAFLKFLVFGLPMITVISIIITLGMIIYFKEIRNMALRKEPIAIKKLKAETKTLQEKLAEINKLNQVFEKKLNATSVGGGLSKLSLFMTPSGQVDKTNLAYFQIENPNVLKDKTSLILKFNLKNITVNSSKVAGYLHVTLKHNNNFYHYPKSSAQHDNFSLSYSSGESFATSRFRPVEASFENVHIRGKATFQILVFSRTGDLLHRQIYPTEI